jgi:hypothetical protein
MASRKPGLDVTSPDFRRLVSPLNPSGQPALAALVKLASTDAFHLAMLVGAALLVAGALVNAIGIRNPGQVATQPATESGRLPSVAKESA